MMLRCVEGGDAIREFFVGINTLPALIARRAELTPAAPAHFTQRSDGAWEATTWAEYRGDVAALSFQFASHGVEPGSRFGILAATSLGWEVAQMAAFVCGATVVGIDPYYPDALIDKVVRDLGLSSLIVDDAASLARLSAVTRDDLGFIAFLREAEAGRVRISPLKRCVAKLADRLVLARLRAVMGSNIRYICSGSAPMPAWLLDFCSALGVPVLEAYGTSENLLPISTNRLAERKAGSVGKVVADNEVRIAGDGEVQVRGRAVFDPTLGENRAHAGALTEDGYLATGDLGMFDDEGFLTVRGRRTDAFKLKFI